MAEPLFPRAVPDSAAPAASPIVQVAQSPRIDRRRDALLIVDLQPDFMPGGALAVADGDAIVAPIAALAVSGGFEMIVATQDYHPAGHISFASRHGLPPFSSLRLHTSADGGGGFEQTLWPDHCVQGTPGSALHSALPQTPLRLIIRKGTYQDADSYSAFRENHGPFGVRRTTGLGALLRARGIERVFVCGLARDYCVAWTALDAVSEGFGAFVLDDLCRAVDPSQAAVTDAAFAAAGVRTLLSSDLVFAVTTLAGAPGGTP
jgi:nicotinamidase/pyrazinamidase